MFNRPKKIGKLTIYFHQKWRLPQFINFPYVSVWFYIGTLAIRWAREAK